MHTELKELLIRREEVIADHRFRDSDPEAHLEALREVSGQISEYADRHQPDFDAKLRHYLANSSYQKALDHISS